MTTFSFILSAQPLTAPQSQSWKCLKQSATYSAIYAADWSQTFKNAELDAANVALTRIFRQLTYHLGLSALRGDEMYRAAESGQRD